MKLKVFSVFAAVLFISSSLNATVEIQQADCNSLAMTVANVYEQAGYSYYEAWQAGNWAYEGCITDGGRPGDGEVIIN